MAANIVTGICRFVRLTCDAAQLINSIDKLKTPPAGSDTPLPIRIISVAGQIFAFVLNTAEAGARMAGSSSETLAKIKGGEVFTRGVTTGFQIAEGVMDSKDKLEAFEKVVGPLAGLARSATEHEIRYNQHLLSLPSEQFPELREPIYEGTDEDIRIVGWKTITREECQQRLESAQKRERPLNIIEATVKSGVVSSVGPSVAQGVTNIYQQVVNEIAAYFAAVHAAGVAAPAGVAPVAPVAVPVAAPAAAVVDPLEVDLRTLPFIPQALKNDKYFQDLICPITDQAIRDPVADPNGKTLYERSAIEEWIKTNPISPVTRAPLTVRKLEERPDLKEFIDGRLAFYNERIQEAVKQGLVAPSHPKLLAAAKAENPTYL